MFIHGGTWRFGTAREQAYAAETFIRAGAHFLAVDFASVIDAGGDLEVLATQVRKAIAWSHANAAGFGGDPDRLYVGGHSSGGHLCVVALVTDWQRESGLPADTIKGGLCMSGLYEMEPVRLSWRRGYIGFTEAMAPCRKAGCAGGRHLWQFRDARVPPPKTGNSPPRPKPRESLSN